MYLYRNICFFWITLAMLMHKSWISFLVFNILCTPGFFNLKFSCARTRTYLYNYIKYSNGRIWQNVQLLLEQHLENQVATRKPYLLATWTSKQSVNTYYIVIDKKLIPCQGTTSLAAFDEFFKVHFVFSVSYDDAFSNMYSFLQTTVNTIDVDTTK